MGYVFQVWCGRHGEKPGLLITYNNGETAHRVRDHQEKILNEGNNSGNVWRVWVEKKRGDYNELQRRHAARYDAEDRSRS
jgi:hypothetical protein